MAKLVTSDGVQINLFLDLNSHNTGEGTLLYGPKSQAEMDFIVKGFRNFKTNTEYNDKNRLEFHCTHLIQVTISALMSANPTSSSQYTVPGHSDTKLYFVGDDLILSKTGAKIHRIDLFKSASTNDVLTVNGASPDASGNVTVTVGNDHSTEISNLTTRVTTLENTGGGGGNNALHAPPQTLFLNTDIAKNDVKSTSNETYTYGKSSSNPDYVVSEFQNFKTTHNDKYKLVFYSQDGTFEVVISDLIQINPSSNNYLYLTFDDETSNDAYQALYFIGNDLYYKTGYDGTTGGVDVNTNHPPYRIDMHLNAFGGGVTTVNGQTGDVTVFDGNYNSLSNKPSVYTTSQTYSKTQVDNKISTIAWVNFTSITDGVMNIKDSRNVTSVTDNGPGDYTINFTSGFFSTSDYAISGISISNAGNASAQVCIKSAGAHTGTFGSYPTPELQSNTQVRILVAGTDGNPKDTGMLHIIAVGK